jgi:hypothetical protein
LSAVPPGHRNELIENLDRKTSSRCQDLRCLIARIVRRNAYNTTFGSTKGLPLIDLFAVELEIGRERPLHPAELRECAISGLGTRHFEIEFTGDGDLDFVSFFQTERFDHGRWKTHGQTVAPSGYLHGRYTCAYADLIYC